MGPVKFATVAAIGVGHRRLHGGRADRSSQLAYPALNFDIAWLNFGRMRPLHTSAVIFAFGGNVLIATSLYVVQRTSRARLAGDLLPWFVVLGYNFFILIAGTGYLLGITQSKEYAEPEWYADLFLTVVWVAYLVLFLLTLKKRKEPHIYVANWFYLAFIVTIAMLHLGNNAVIPVSLFSAKSTSVGGVQDAMVQWWYGPQRGSASSSPPASWRHVLLDPPSAPSGRCIPTGCSIIHFWALDLPSTSGRRTTSTTRPLPRLGRRNPSKWCSRSCCGCPPGAALITA